jgi:MFS family permease
MESTGFGEYFLEQDFLVLLALTAGIAAGYLVVVSGGAAALAGLRSHSTGARPFLLASAVTLALFVMLFTLFEAAALYFRYDPHGTGTERQGADREEFVSLAKTGFALLYVAVPLVGAGAGYAVARRLRSAQPWRVAAAVTIAVVAFLALTFPFAEFENACNIGEGVILEPSC